MAPTDGSRRIGSDRLQLPSQPLALVLLHIVGKLASPEAKVDLLLGGMALLLGDGWGGPRALPEALCPQRETCGGPKLEEKVVDKSKKIVKKRRRRSRSAAASDAELDDNSNSEGVDSDAGAQAVYIGGEQKPPGIDGNSLAEVGCNSYPTDMCC